MDRIKTTGDQVVELNLNVLVFQEGEFFVSYCPSLNISSYGDSIQEAKDAFDELLRSYIDEWRRFKTLRKDLTAHGWKFTRIKDDCYKPKPPSQVDLDIPAGLLKRQFNDNWKIPVC